MEVSDWLAHQGNLYGFLRAEFLWNKPVEINHFWNIILVLKFQLGMDIAPDVLKRFFMILKHTVICVSNDIFAAALFCTTDAPK